MPPLTYPDQSTIDSWKLRTRGIRDGTHPTERLEIDTSQVDGMSWFCVYEHRFAAAEYLLGKQALYEDSGTTKLSRLLPCHHPDHPHLIVTKVVEVKGHKFLEDFEDEAGNPPIPTYEEAEIKVLLEHAPFELVEDADTADDETSRYVELGPTEAGVDVLQLPGAVFAHIAESGAGEAHNKSIPFNFGKPVPVETFHVLWHRLPFDVWTPGSPLFDRVYGTAEGDIPYKGTINKGEFFGRPIGTVMFEHVKPTRAKEPFGEYSWTLDFQFAYKPSGWNWVYYFGTVATPAADRGWFFVGPRDGAFHTADTVPDNYSLFNARELYDLFNPDDNP